MSKNAIFEMSVGLFGGLGVFLYGMRVMSRGLESVNGEKLRHWIRRFTNHPVLGVLTGLIVTCIIQSSSATTVMLVSLVHAGLLNLAQSIGVIMGANIGTTITGWIVSLLGFKIKISKFALPAVGIGVVLIFLGKKGQRRGVWGEILVGFGLLFLGLMFMKKAVGFLKGSSSISALMKSFSASQGIGYLLLAVAIGAFVTILIQSSSATMALTITLAQQGLINFPTAAALILGENIGTTITANLAALGAEHTAKQTARAHFFFNIVGTTWAVLLFYPLITLVDSVVPGASTNAQSVPIHMSAFHSIFNITNTLLFLPFVGAFARFIERIVPRKETDTSKHQVLFLDTQLASTVGLSLAAANSEIQRMGQQVNHMLESVHILCLEPKDNYEKLSPEVLQLENQVNALDRGITDYLVKVSREEMSDELSLDVNRFLDLVHRFEKIGDHCELLHTQATQCVEKNVELPNAVMDEVSLLFKLIKKQFALVVVSLTERSETLFQDACKIEEEIEELHSKLREKRVEGMVSGSFEVQSGLIIIEMIDHLERIGEHSFKAAQSLSGNRIQKA